MVIIMKNRCLLTLALFSGLALAADDVSLDSLPSVYNTPLPAVIKNRILSDVAAGDATNRSLKFDDLKPRPTITKHILSDKEVKQSLEKAKSDPAYPKASLLKPLDVSSTELGSCSMLNQIPSGQMKGAGLDGMTRLFSCPVAGNVLVVEQLKGSGAATLLKELVNSNVNQRPAHISNKVDADGNTQASIFWIEKNRTVLLVSKKTDPASLQWLKSQAEKLSLVAGE